MSASESENETSMEESPVIKSRPILKSEGSEEYESEETKEDAAANQTDDNDEDDDDDEEQDAADEEETESDEAEPPNTISAVKTSIGPAKTASSKIPQSKPLLTNEKQMEDHSKPHHPSYDKMVLEAMTKLDEHKRSGVSIVKIIKFISSTCAENSRMKFFCRKAIEKGINEDLYMKTTGVGFSGSINFSAKYRQKQKQEKAKALKATAAPKVKAKSNTKKLPAKPKPASKKAAPLKKAEPKPTKAKPKKDANNNSKTTVTKKTTTGPKAKISKTSGKVRLSIAAPTTIKPKAKPKTAPAETNKTKKTVANKMLSKPANPKAKTEAVKMGPKKTKTK